jgi:hypothetical protein
MRFCGVYVALAAWRAKFLSLGVVAKVPLTEEQLSTMRDGIK